MKNGVDRQPALELNVLINGRYQKNLDISDRGLHYGDGLFETIEVYQAQPLFLQQHLARIEAGCQVLKIPFPSELLLLAEIAQICQSVSQGVVKLMLTRGSGGRGYRQPETISVTRILALYPFPACPESYQTQGVKIRFCQLRLSLNPTLAGLKHNNRLEQVLARTEWGEEYQEGLMLNLNEHVIEGTMSNLFVIKNSILYTPEITLSGVKGIIRDIVIQLAKQHDMTVIEKQMSQEAVYQADALFVTNSVIGLWSIKQLDTQKYQPSALTQHLKSLFLLFKQQDYHDV